MSSYVLLALAGSRSRWPARIAGWTASGTPRLRLHRCASPAELRARLASGRRLSAVLVDPAFAGLDRDLVAAARAAGCPTVVVSDGSDPHGSEDHGATAHLPPDFDRSDLLAVLAAAATVVPDVMRSPFAPAPPPVPSPWSGRLVAVCGPGGTGTSTVAAAIAQALAESRAAARRVVLADLALDADQALLHAIDDDAASFVDLVEAHRNDRHDADVAAACRHRVDAAWLPGDPRAPTSRRVGGPTPAQCPSRVGRAPGRLRRARRRHRRRRRRRDPTVG